jgi:hypothetical protein
MWTARGNKMWTGRVNKMWTGRVNKMWTGRGNKMWTGRGNKMWTGRVNKMWTGREIKCELVGEIKCELVGEIKCELVGEIKCELVGEIGNRMYKLTVISLTNNKLKWTKIKGKYIMVYSWVSQDTRAQSGVTLINDHKWSLRITNYSFVSDLITSVRLKTNISHITIRGVYAPEGGREKKKK